MKVFTRQFKNVSEGIDFFRGEIAKAEMEIGKSTLRFKKDILDISINSEIQNTDIEDWKDRIREFIDKEGQEYSDRISKLQGDIRIYRIAEAELEIKKNVLKRNGGVMREVEEGETD